MKNQVTLRGDNSNILSVYLNDILCFIENGEKFLWKILWITAIGKNEEQTVLKFEKEVNESKNGYAIRWPDLCRLSDNFDQITELLIIGDSEASSLKRYNMDSEMNSKCEFVIELIDSSYWDIRGKNTFFIDRLRDKLL